MDPSEVLNEKELLAERIESHLYAEYGKSVAHAGEHEYWTALSRAVMELIGPSWEATRKLYQEGARFIIFPPSSRWAQFAQQSD